MSRNRLSHNRLLLVGLSLSILVLWRFAANAQSHSATSAATSGEKTAPAYERNTKEAREAKDYVKLNGPLFTEPNKQPWPKPQLAIVLSGEMDGYIEPCGCTGLENQMGGLKRRHTFLNELKEKGWPLVEFDMGGLTKRLGHQTEIKFRYAIDSLVKLGYDAVGLGANELRLTTDELVYAIANLPPEKNPILSANVGIYSFDSGMTRTHHVAEAGGKRIGVTSVLGKKYEKSLANVNDVVYRSPEEGLAEIAPKLATEKCDLQVLMVYGPKAEALALAKKFPQFNFVGVAAGVDVPPLSLEKVSGTNSVLVEVGHKGKYVVVLGIYDDAKNTLRYQRVPLDARFDDSSAMQKMMVRYQEELKLQGLEGLGLSGSAHPEGKFVGSEVCADCHSSATEVFENTPHSHATESIINISVPPRHHDPECLSCHVTGWNPQQYFPYSSGYESLEKTPHLRANGCENCHGPGAAHVAAELGESDVNDAEQEALRAALRMKIVENEGNKSGQVYGKVVESCMQCHDQDNSPDFDFQKYWEDVKHVGKD
ncbi:multiheme c-type cytochrome [Adhaeretor mobilis]|uniref:Cytochrome c-554 n=1 Tax=Adhaeretor mobilis TaxID=1930276 RepID=A0A517MZY9_9BACT|nr:multiheme c-type cytochrome [Adhaeretor mobilis]QDT00446.1 Cytochrome c-554 precursor [Adhaeretor mobilis]